jgi:hypothetical protein
MARTIPSKDRDLISWSRGFSLDCAENADVWKLDNVLLAALLALVGKAEDAYKIHMNPMTTGRASTIAKNLAFAELRAALSPFIKKLEVNDNVSDKDLEALGLQPRRHVHHRPLPPPTEAPALVAYSGKHETVDLSVSVPEEGRPTRYMKKKGFHGVLVRYRLEDNDHWFEKPSTRLRVTLAFEEQHVGKRLLVSAAWLNPRLEHGPWSDPIALIIN